MYLRQALLVALAPVVLFSCVSTKKFKAEQAKYTTLNDSYAKLQNDLKACEDQKAEEARKKAALQTEIDNLNKQIAFLKENNTQALKQLQDLSVISSAQAESIKKSMENIGAKDSYIQTLQQQMARKDSLNMALVMNLKGAIGNLDDKDINIKVDKGVVYIDISDKLLFKTGKYDVTEEAKVVLGKVATVLKNQPDIEFMVEGHTDNVPFARGVLLDNWDLSVKRATSVVRILQNQYGLDPAKMSAAGRGEYSPLMPNDSPESKAANRRTRIVILPQLDQFFKLLERK
ncbi:OmpA family protein [Pseudoflavitalea sp. X16]|uniref:OmpA family protein n=1 Tax=Paraflavitalea devenefica TaxID=2716334 RepID=UPI001423CD8B|nr:OmpA family protein [Paraflavitalea devenefica]NII24451.1 OmpA family protein [Paraflavitalea devenefica]